MLWAMTSARFSRAAEDGVPSSFQCGEYVEFTRRAVCLQRDDQRREPLTLDEHDLSQRPGHHL